MQLGSGDTRAVGLADRDYMRAPQSAQRSRMSLASIVLGLAILALAAILFRDHFPGRSRPLVMSVKPLWVGASIRVGSPYAPNDAWTEFLPPPNACPDSTADPTSEAAAEEAMLCALNYARLK